MAKPSSRVMNVDHVQDDKLFSRLLSRKKYNPSKQGESSFRVLYYAGATGSVPFTWESQPGTPKHQLGDHPPPPLTPPPQYRSRRQASSPLHKKHSKNNSKIFNSILRKVPSKKGNASPFLSSSSLSFHDGFKARSRSIIYVGPEEDEYEHEASSPTSTLCFGPRNGSPLRKFKGYSSPMKSVKKAVMSIVGHGNSN